jgi:hypothetical protein
VAHRLSRWPLLIAAVVVLGAVGAIIAACERPPEPSVGAYCREIGAAEGLDESLAGMDPDVLQPDVSALRRAVRVAPIEIATQIDTVLALTTALERTLQTARTDQADALAQTLRDRSDDLGAATAAGRAVEDYTRANCGIELNSTSSPGPVN